MAWLPCLPFPALTGPSRLPRAAGVSRVLCAPPALTCILGVWEPPQHPQAGGWLPGCGTGSGPALAARGGRGREWDPVDTQMPCASSPAACWDRGEPRLPPRPTMLCGRSQGRRCPGSQSGIPTCWGCSWVPWARWRWWLLQPSLYVHTPAALWSTDGAGMSPTTSLTYRSTHMSTLPRSLKKGSPGAGARLYDPLLP